MSLHDADQQADPGRGAEGAAHLGQQGDAADEAQRAPAAVLLQGHQAVGVDACRRRQERERRARQTGRTGRSCREPRQTIERTNRDLDLL